MKTVFNVHILKENDTIVVDTGPMGKNYKDLSFNISDEKANSINDGVYILSGEYLNEDNKWLKEYLPSWIFGLK